MKHILVTGADGFIGTALVNKLELMGVNVLKFNSANGNVAEYDFIKEYKDIEINHIFHLAAKTFIPDSWDKPLEFYRTSVIGTGNILELCRTKNISCTFVSSYLYGQPEKLPIAESDKIKSNNPYAHSKYLAEELCKFYAEFYNVNITIIRPFNIYGKRQKDIFLIPHIIHQVLNDKTIMVKDLNPKRDYLYLDDFIEGLVKTIAKTHGLKIFNFGSGTSISVKEIIEIIQKIAHTNKKVISEEVIRDNEIMNVIADISSAKHKLNWEPKYNFESGIQEIIGDIQQ
ncbi:MAG: NAD(P)-dependent oxidoreductase [Sulfurimonadaceae bacterium]|jgi:nucleoside-diphosphate-sugar epimerase|nr:NAD(P)-dependent oxidoreductase [Sulfurimonadaceae bacterium]